MKNKKNIYLTPMSPEEPLRILLLISQHQLLSMTLWIDKEFDHNNNKKAFERGSIACLSKKNSVPWPHALAIETWFQNGKSYSGTAIWKDPRRKWDFGSRQKLKYYFVFYFQIVNTIGFEKPIKRKPPRTYNCHSPVKFWGHFFRKLPLPTMPIAYPLKTLLKSL